MQTLDAQGRVLTHSYGAASTERHVRDGFGRLIGLDDGRKNRVVTVEYDAMSRVHAREYAGGLRVVTTYDAAHWPLVETGSDGSELRHTYAATLGPREGTARVSINSNRVSLADFVTISRLPPRRATSRL